MTLFSYANRVTTTLNGAINNSVDSLTLASGTGFPTSNFVIRIDSELILVGTRSGTGCSGCTRGYESSGAASHADGASVFNPLSAAMLEGLGAAIHRTAAYASRPSAATEGRLFLPSDAYAMERDTGSAWAPFGPVFPLTAPSDTGFAWVNQGSSSLVTSLGALTLVGAATGTGANIVARVKTAPSTPYVITAYVLPTMVHKAFQSYGLCFRQSSDGKLALLDIAAVDLGLTTPNVRSVKFTNATTFSADYINVKVSELFRWLRIADNGTNRICSISADGQNWLDVHSVGRTDFLTADQVGFMVATENSATPNFAPILSVLSWKQS